MPPLQRPIIIGPQPGKSLTDTKARAVLSASGTAHRRNRPESVCPGPKQTGCRPERQSLSANSYWPVGRSFTLRCWVPGGRPPFRGLGPLPQWPTHTRKGSAGGAGGAWRGGLGHNGFEGVAGLVDVAVFQGGVHQEHQAGVAQFAGEAARRAPGRRPGSTSPGTPPNRSRRSTARRAQARRTRVHSGIRARKPMRRPVRPAL
jgi:hypothetical protein